MSKIHVIDAPCGAGKSYAMAKMINTKLGGYNYIYVTPRLEDFKEFSKNIEKTFGLKGFSLANIEEKDLINSMFTEPKSKDKGGKLADLKRLIKKNKNITTTHALFKICDDEFVELVKERNYTLILDESISVVEPITSVCDMDLRAMQFIKLISIAKDGQIIYNKDNNYPPSGAHTKQLYKFKNDSVFAFKKKMLVWTFPIKFFKCFKEVYICTFRFKTQLQRYYFDYFNIEYELLTLKNREIMPYEKQYPNLNRLHICQDMKLNAIGEKEAGKRRNSTLSMSWYANASNIDIITLKNNVYNFFRNRCKATAKECLWTCYSSDIERVKSKGFYDRHEPWNTRGTNKYNNVHNVAYLVNLFMHPHTSEFFKQKDIRVDVDEWALSELIQFIWRSAIRKDEDINLYLPSSRMRELLEQYIRTSKLKIRAF